VQGPEFKLQAQQRQKKLKEEKTKQKQQNAMVLPSKCKSQWMGGGEREREVT
jgi:hypothetical protein